MDWVWGMGGHNDYVSGARGDDVLHGGGGDDGLWDDTYNGDLDLLCGENHDDYMNIEDGDGFDDVKGGPGTDSWDRDPYPDTVSQDGECTL